MSPKGGNWRMSESAAAATPVARGERIVAIDVLRGFAILGILIINIQSFAMVDASYLNPAATWPAGELTGANLWVWAVSYLLGDQKFMTIFSVLFGAGIVLMSGRAEAKGIRTVGLHYRRQFWLLLIGMGHAYLLWSGDILVTYALCALLLYWFRNLSPRALIVLGVVVVGVSSMLSLSAQFSMPYWGEEQIEDGRLGWAPPPEELQSGVDAYRGGWWEQMPQRAATALVLQTFIFLVWFGWRAGGLMLIGMALFKLGVLTAAREDAFYKRMLLCLPVGLGIVAYGISRNLQEGFAFEYSMFLGAQFNYWGSMLVSLGYVAIVMLVCRRGLMTGLTDRLAACGRMALTNYLTQTIICTLIFYGHGLGLYERVQRPGQVLIVLGVWAAQLLWSPWWLARYSFGPFEWAWRSLTYVQLQPLRRAAELGG